MRQRGDDHAAAVVGGLAIGRRGAIATIAPVLALAGATLVPPVHARDGAPEERRPLVCRVPDGARATLEVDRPVYLPGEDVHVRFCLHNDGAAPFRFDPDLGLTRFRARRSG